MPKRTLGLETIRARPGHNRKKNYADLTDLDGSDLLALFNGWATHIDESSLVDSVKKRYTKIVDVRRNGRTVTVDAEYGFFGEKGNTRHIKTGAVSHTRSEEESATIMTRLSLTVPPKATIGVFGIERQGNVGAGPTLIAAFKLALISAYPKIAFEGETVLESAAWVDGANLLAVEAVAYAVPVNIANGLTAVPSIKGTVRQSLVPEKGANWLPHGILDGLRSKKLKASDLVAFPAGVTADDTFVTVGRDGRQKTFSIDHQREPSIRVLLTADGEAALGSIKFLRRCQTEVQDFYETWGMTWNKSWQDGQWSKTALAVRLSPAVV